jgi:MoaA/NifB/PqqE/SkfB family radical SAM enzyme
VRRAVFVSWQGDVAPCVLTNHSLKGGTAPVHYFRGRSYPVSSCVFGNVNEASFEAIWKSDAARTFRDAFERRLKKKRPGTDDLPESCKHCYKLYEP